MEYTGYTILIFKLRLRGGGREKRQIIKLLKSVKFSFKQLTYLYMGQGIIHTLYTVLYCTIYCMYNKFSVLETKAISCKM